MSLKNLEQFLVSLKVSIKKRKSCFLVKHSSLLLQVCLLLIKQGFLVSFSKTYKNGILFLKIFLNKSFLFNANKSRICNIRCYMKPRLTCFYNLEFFLYKKNDFSQKNYNTQVYIYTTNDGLYTRTQIDKTFHTLSSNNMLLLVLDS